MSTLRAVRRPLLVSFILLALAALACVVVSQAWGARRFGRLRPASRAPASSPAKTPAAPTPYSPTPTPATDPQRPEPPPPLTASTLRDDLVRVAGHQDEPAVAEEILEIRRRIRRDPSFRSLTEASRADAAAPAERYETSEPAFKRLLEIIGTSEEAEAGCKSTCDNACETKLSFTFQAEGCSAGECCSGASSGSALRAAARALETRASACEDAKAFTRSDELRELARQLWQEARRSDNVAAENGVKSFTFGISR